MPATDVVRIRRETREALRELERETGQRPADLVARAVDQFRRSLVLAETNVAYGALRADGDAWAAAEDARTDWEQTLSDGLEAD
jgi:hypothetical protein